MKVFICPTNISFMPYIDLYNDSCEDAVFLVWDRFGVGAEKEDSVIYRDQKKGHKRNFFDYLFFSFFVARWLLKNAKPDSQILMFGAQVTFFIWPLFFIKKYLYAIDYRDYHSLTKFTPKLVYSNAAFVAISSPSYKSIFPKKTNTVVSHNYKSTTSIATYKKACYPVSISCIGAIRDFSANSELILKLGNNQNFSLDFHGSGIAEESLKNLAANNGIKNVFFTGFYKKEDEERLYLSAAFINLLRHSDTYNDKVALPNRLYNSAQYRVPILCYKGTLLSDYVEKYNLGLCLEYEDNFSEVILNYLNEFDADRFEQGVYCFLRDIEAEQDAFIRIYKYFFG